MTSTTNIVPTIDLRQVLKSLNLSAATNIVTSAYYDQGYTGEFGAQTYFEMDIDSSNKPFAILHSPAYTPYMLYGRGPGKMPPAEPIENWMQQYGIDGSSWAIRKHIADFGVQGNDFIEPVMPQARETIVEKMKDAITKALTSN